MACHTYSKSRSSHCENCFKKQCKIDELEEELRSLKVKMREQERRLNEGCFGSSTPSSKIPIKANTRNRCRKSRGACYAHTGHSRESHNPQSVITQEIVCSETNCPVCGSQLDDKGFSNRSVTDLVSDELEKKNYKVQKKYCSKCHKVYKGTLAGVLPKSLYGNQLISRMAAYHYLHGIPIGRISEMTGVCEGSIAHVFKRLSDLLAGVMQLLISEYQQSPVKHADETGWRVDGQNAYTWLFATDTISIFCCGKSRSGSIAREILGSRGEKQVGTVVVDRYAGYNKVACNIQYCYAHLIRDVKDLQKRHPKNEEVKSFVSALVPEMSKAIQLRNKPINDVTFDERAQKIKNKIQYIINSDAKYEGIRTIQDLFRTNAHRMYHWASDRNIPADNNRAERDLRPTVVARKVSFGSFSETGTKTREILTSILQTLKKRHRDPTKYLKKALDIFVLNKEVSYNEVFKTLFED